MNKKNKPNKKQIKKIAFWKNSYDYIRNNPLRVLLLIAFLLSGFSGLVYEVLWVRMLNLIFGVTAFATSTVLSTYMSGIALGSWFFGKLIVKSRKSPIFWYIILEIGIAISALASPLLFKLLDSFYLIWYPALQSHFYITALIRFISAFVILIIPSALMGGTLPIISQYFIKELKGVAGGVGALYSLNTLGAVLGTFLTGFFFIDKIGVQKTLFLAVGVNLLIAIMIALAYKLFNIGTTKPIEVSPSPTKKEKKDKKAKKDKNIIKLSPKALKVILIGFAFSGFT